MALFQKNDAETDAIELENIDLDEGKIFNDFNLLLTVFFIFINVISKYLLALLVNIIQIIYYNHFFLTVGNIFSDKQVKGIEDHKPVNQSEVKWELDDYQLKQLEKLGLGDNNNEEDYISRQRKKQET